MRAGGGIAVEIGVDCRTSGAVGASLVALSAGDGPVDFSVFTEGRTAGEGTLPSGSAASSVAACESDFEGEG